MKQIQLEGKISLEDKEAREMLMRLDTKIATINERTKTHTLDIQQLRKELKELKSKWAP